MSEAPQDNPYAPPTAAVADTGPPSRFLLGCVVLLHSVWCGVSFTIVLGIVRSQLSSMTVALFILPIGYALMIHRMWCKRRWAWRASWLPILVFTLFGALVVFSFAMGAIQKMSRLDWVLLGLILMPGVLLVPLQWKARSEL